MPRLTRKSPKTPRARKAGSPGDSAFKIRIRGRDNAALSMRELREGLMEAAKRLEPYEARSRAKWATIYLTLVDEDGQPVQIDAAGEWTIFPYKCAADEHGA